MSGTYFGTLLVSGGPFGGLRAKQPSAKRFS